MRTLRFCCALAALAIVSPPAQMPSRPNVVMILMDDLGYGDIGSLRSLVAKWEADVNAELKQRTTSAQD